MGRGGGGGGGEEEGGVLECHDPPMAPMKTSYSSTSVPCLSH